MEDFQDIRWCTGCDSNNTMKHFKMDSKGIWHCGKYGTAVTLGSMPSIIQAFNPISAPEHYVKFKITPLDAIEEWDLGFCLGNAVKYIGRAGHKGDKLEDLKKAAWYLNHEIKRIEEATKPKEQ